MKLSDYIRNYRIQKGMSQKQMSKFLDINRTSMSFIENDREVGIVTKQRLASKLGMKYEEIDAMEKNAMVKPRKKADLDTEIERLKTLDNNYKRKSELELEIERLEKLKEQYEKR